MEKVLYSTDTDGALKMNVSGGSFFPNNYDCHTLHVVYPNYTDSYIYMLDTKSILHHLAARSSSVPGAFVLGHHKGLLDQQWSAITLAACVL